MKTGLVIALVLGAGILFAQSEGDTARLSAGFVDADRDGINDRFADADGDGVNDVTGLPYTRHFAFRDSDGDGINDLWKDADGDGVNDWLGRDQKDLQREVDRDGDGIPDTVVGGIRGRELMAYVLDTDGDGRNDITGEAYSGRDLGGYRKGCMDEERGVLEHRFRDENGDGMHDGFVQRLRERHGQGHPAFDRFIDADGDGIADDRGLGRFRRKGGQGKKK
jgi:hypothetical protein